MVGDGTEVLTAAEMRRVDADAIASGAVTGLDLMERAGAAVAGHVRLRWPRPGRVTVLCGRGNNGGDGYVVARHLHEAGWRVRVLGTPETPAPDAAVMRRRWADIGPVLPLTEDVLRSGEGSDVYVDAIFGAGLTRAPEGEIAGILHHMGGGGGDWAYYQPRIVAVDAPSGLCLDSGVFLGKPRGPQDFDLRCRLTVTFDSPKPGHLLARGPACCGELVVADIGLHRWRVAGRRVDKEGRARDVGRPALLTALWPRFAIPDSRRLDGHDRKRGLWLTKRETGADHKYGHGHAVVIAGGLAEGGAARLAARAALRTGAGLVSVAPPRSALVAHLGPPDAPLKRGLDDAEALRAVLQDPRVTAVCLGPGSGVDRAAALLPSLLETKRPAVLDADALTALAGIGLDGLHGGCVLTPHEGEFARLFPDIAARLRGPVPPAPLSSRDFSLQRVATFQSDAATFRAALDSERGPVFSKVDAVREAATLSGAIVLLKGPDTVIAAPPPRHGRQDMPGKAVIHSAFDVPWLATAGSGDVLAGIIVGLMARSLDPLAAASTAVWLHAEAARRFGPGLVADDLPEMIPAVLRRLLDDGARPD